jgi:hypothetical protein
MGWSMRGRGGESRKGGFNFVGWFYFGFFFFLKKSIILDTGGSREILEQVRMYWVWVLYLYDLTGFIPEHAPDGRENNGNRLLNSSKNKM